MGTKLEPASIYTLRTAAAFVAMATSKPSAVATAAFRRAVIMESANVPCEAVRELIPRNTLEPR